MNDFVLMYHRVCLRTRETEPWFTRGTAVTPTAFALQLDWLLARCDIVPLEEVLGPPSRRPRVSLTFDDGYAEIGESVRDLCAARDVPATCFASAAPSVGGEPLWFDAWYAILATGPAPEALRLLAEWGAPVTGEGDWITGAARRWLGALPTDLRAGRVAQLLEVAPANPPAYLTVEGLRALTALGWTIGGHGDRHPRLADVGEEEIAHEVRRSAELLGRVGVSPAVFAYPDGAYDERVERAVGEAGFRVACTVERGAVGPDTHPLRVPRLFCRGDEPVPHRALEVLR